MIIKVEAMIREEKLEDVLDALAALDVHGITCYQVMGCGTSVVSRNTPTFVDTSR